MSDPSLPAGGEAGEGRTAEPPLPALYAGRLAGDKSVERMATFVIKAAVELGLVGALGPEPRLPADVARAIGGADVESLHRLLRALTVLDVAREEGDAFAAGPMARFLPPAVEIEPVQAMEEAWCGLAEAIRSGRTAFEVVHGENLFDYLSHSPDLAAAFAARMHERGEERDRAVASAYDFTQFGTIVDVGGGTGGLLTRILERAPAARGIVFDLPHTITSAREEQARRPGPPLDLVEGDIFSQPPPPADLHILSSILHDWNDDEALVVLRNVRAAMPPDGRLLIVEFVLPSDGSAPRLWLADIEMMALTGGRERTAEEYSRIAGAAGLRVADVLPTDSSWSIVDARTT